MPDNYDIRDNMGRKIGTATATGGCASAAPIFFIVMLALSVYWIIIGLILGLILTPFKLGKKGNKPGVIYWLATIGLIFLAFLLVLFDLEPDYIIWGWVGIIIAWIFPNIHETARHGFISMFSEFFQQSWKVIKAPFVFIGRIFGIQK